MVTSMRALVTAVIVHLARELWRVTGTRERRRRYGEGYSAGGCDQQDQGAR